MGEHLSSVSWLLSRNVLWVVDLVESNQWDLGTTVAESPCGVSTSFLPIRSCVIHPPMAL